MNIHILKTDIIIINDNSYTVKFSKHSWSISIMFRWKVGISIKSDVTPVSHVNNNKIPKINNSILSNANFQSNDALKYWGLKVPKQTRLKSQIEYTALKITLSVAIINTSVFLSARPTTIKNSPTKLEVPGNAMLASEKLKKKKENLGIKTEKPP